MVQAKRNPVRAPARRRSLRRQPRWKLRITLAALAVVAATFLWATVARSLAPRANTSRQSFDAILILGAPADADGNPTPAIIDRVSEGVREYEHGVARHIIVSGAAAHNRFVEAEVMARVARAQGIPPSAIILEPRALDTIQNACYSASILKQHGWHSAEIVSGATHLPRAALILSNLQHQYPLEWRVHAAPEILAPPVPDSVLNLAEILKTARYLTWSRWVEPCSP